MIKLLSSRTPLFFGSSDLAKCSVITMCYNLYEMVRLTDRAVVFLRDRSFVGCWPTGSRRRGPRRGRCATLRSWSRRCRSCRRRPPLSPLSSPFSRYRPSSNSSPVHFSSINHYIRLTQFLTFLCSATRQGSRRRTMSSSSGCRAWSSRRSCVTVRLRSHLHTTSFFLAVFVNVDVPSTIAWIS